MYINNSSVLVYCVLTLAITHFTIGFDFLNQKTFENNE